MKPMKKKTRERLSKLTRKLVKKHGEEAVVGLVTTAATAEAAKTAHTPVAAIEQPAAGKSAKKPKAPSPSMVSV